MTAAKEILEFSEWLLSRGRSEGTVRIYCIHVETSMKRSGPLNKLNDKSLAPKTRRTVLAALKAWYRFKRDLRMEETLKDVRLPPAIRVEAREPLSIEDWRTLRDEIDRADYIPATHRAVLALIARRGFRVGDVLRMKRSEVVAGISSPDIDFEGKKSKRLSWRSGPLKEYLKILANEKGWSRVCDLITTSKNRTQSQAVENIERSLAIVAETVGLEGVYPHRLRRTYAVAFLETLAGRPDALLMLQQHFGWSDLATASQYLDHSRRELLDEAEEKLEEKLER